MESNHRPAVYETAALPTELRRLQACGGLSALNGASYSGCFGAVNVHRSMVVGCGERLLSRRYA